ncbi:hypothetical protein MPPM_2684 [Methylorubrum populi]|uniref:Uncharacterized protein n=1 Tax=Methylorubrum populi TaxID=223967 RepID=A0A160PDY4_9HYPH|nr:hypothetical protein [Methylorubrum populi]BAU91289.1 hypothetical protein MPPM_2684 [Methylorubrum populi]
MPAARSGSSAAAIAGPVLAVLAALAGPSQAGPTRGGNACYLTGGGALEICRSDDEAEGVYAVPPPCRFVHDVQILRLKETGAPGPLQVIYRAEPPRGGGRRGEDACPSDLRATDPAAGGAVRIGRQIETLATILPPTDPRFWSEGLKGSGSTRAEQPRRRSRASRQARREARRAAREARQGDRQAEKMTFRPQAPTPEDDPSGNAMMVAGRDWAGDPYYAILATATEPSGEGRRRVLVQARTYDFQSLDLRVEADPGTEWRPFGAPAPEEKGRRRGRGRSAAAAKPAPVLDDTGKPIVGNCVAPDFEARGLTGSISAVDRVYHYFYTDVVPADCEAPRSKRRMALYLRTSRDPLAERTWSAPVTLIESLPAETEIRVAKARGMDRWALAYTCSRPVTVSGGPVADICLHYTSDLSPGSITALALYAEPVAAGHSTAFLGLRSGGDALGRFTRDGFGWMTDRYGNLDAPAIYPDKGGFLTWLDRRAPRIDGGDASSLYGRPVFWATWTVRPRAAQP